MLCVPLQKALRIAMVGKYNGLSDAYLSVIKALQHACLKCKSKLQVGPKPLYLHPRPHMVYPRCIRPRCMRASTARGGRGWLFIPWEYTLIQGAIRLVLLSVIVTLLHAGRKCKESLQVIRHP